MATTTTTTAKRRSRTAAKLQSISRTFDMYTACHPASHSQMLAARTRTQRAPDELPVGSALMAAGVHFLLAGQPDAM